jgi:hypothetical protein
MVAEKYLLDLTSSYYAKGKRDQKTFPMGIVNEVQQLDNNTEITLATCLAT